MLAACDSVEAMATLIKSEGVVVSVSELNEFLAAVSAQSNSDELNKDPLDAVSGGSILGVAIYALYKALKKGNFSAGGGGGGR